MASGSDHKIRSIKDNPAGTVVADSEGNRWQWSTDDDTALQLKKLSNDELAIERTDIRPSPATDNSQGAAVLKPKTEPRKPMAKRRDAGGGFNPYDNPGRSRRR
jgi:hypothetical protein